MGLQEWFERWRNGGPLINIDFGNLAQALRDLNINIKLFSDNKKEIHHHYDEEKNTFNVNMAELTSHEKKSLAKESMDLIDAEFMIIDENAEDQIKEIKVEESTLNSSEIIKFFQGKVSRLDLEMIRAGLFIRKRYAEHQPIGKLKYDVAVKYGRRGNNIVNLCSEDYLEKYLMPLYEILLKESGEEQVAISNFYEIFDKIVKELPFTIFVNHTMNPRQVKDQILEKVEKNIKYGVKFLNIHGIGKHNVKTIQETISVIEKDPRINVTSERKKERIFVALEF